MDDKLYWIWFSLAFSYGSDKPNQILTQFENPKDFYQLSAEEMLKLGFLSEKEIKTIKSISMLRAEKIINDCNRHNIDIVTFEDKRYPNRLKLIYGPPMVLYVKGNISAIDDEVCITIVGTRKATDYSSYVTEYLSYHLAKANAIIVSGCALGIDTAAHIGALKAGGKTISVLACGLDVDYPSENRMLKEKIIETGGAVISELPPGTEVNSKIFHVRNRIMAGLGLGVLVTHAPEKSGSLITVEHAIEQGKEVFCVPPYSIFDSQFFGVIKYLRDGAIPVFSAKDILIEYYSTHSHKLDATKIIGDYINQKRMEENYKQDKPPKQPQSINVNSLTKEQLQELKESINHKNKDIIDNLNENQITVYNCLDLEPKFIDEIASSIEIAMGEVLSILTELEILGVASSFSGRRYALNKE